MFKTKSRTHYLEATKALRAASPLLSSRATLAREAATDEQILSPTTTDTFSPLHPHEPPTSILPTCFLFSSSCILSPSLETRSTFSQPRSVTQPLLSLLLLLLRWYTLGPHCHNTKQPHIPSLVVTDLHFSCNTIADSFASSSSCDSVCPGHPLFCAPHASRFFFDHSTL